MQKGTDRGMGHNHSHSAGIGTATGRHRGRLAIVLGIYVTIILTALAGAAITGSLALIAEAGHMAVDAAGIAIALLAAWLATWRPNDRRTFGLLRAEILAVIVNCLLLFGLGAFILLQAVERWRNPAEVEGAGVIVFAVIGLVGNAASLVLLTRGASESLNVRAAFLEVLSDAIGAAAILISGILIVTTGFTRADAIAAALIGILILPRAWKLLSLAVNIIMQGVPAGTDLVSIREHILATDGVADMHNLHVWALTSGVPVLSVHIVVDEQRVPPGQGSAQVLDKLTECLRHDFGIQHCTFQLEPSGHRDHEGTL